MMDRTLKRLWRVVLLASLCWGIVGVSVSQAGDVWTTPFAGLRHLHRTSSNQNIHVLLIDLCKAGISLKATASSQRKRTPESFGNLIGAHAAINGDFFSFSNYSTDGLAMSGGQAWAGTADHSYVAPVSIGAGRIEIPHHNNTNQPASWIKEVVSGHPTLLDNNTFVGNNGDPLCTNRHPRTAIGITQDHKTMIWAVVDGRSTARIGMTCLELANLLKGFGAFDAVNMDGGGSSSMWIRGKGTVNVPSDGSARVVGNHLAVFAKGSGNPGHCPCKAGCQGSKILGADCGVGDCAVYGATCVDDSLGVRCISVFCPAKGKKKVCVSDKLLGECDNGGIKTGDCSKFVGLCSTAGAAEARCVSAFCVKDPKVAPVPHDICLPDGRLASCNADGAVINPKACPAGTKCTPTANRAACVDPNAPIEAPLPPVESAPLEPTPEKPSALEHVADDKGTEAGPIDGDGDTTPGFPDAAPPSDASQVQEQAFTQEQASGPQEQGAPAGGDVLVLNPEANPQVDEFHHPGGCGCLASSGTAPQGLWWMLFVCFFVLWRKR